MEAAFECPITYAVMDDPVMDPEGVSYERDAILTWLRSHSTSPVTRRPLRSRDLRPNRALKDAIERWRATGRTDARIDARHCGGRAEARTDTRTQVRAAPAISDATEREPPVCGGFLMETLLRAFGLLGPEEERQPEPVWPAAYEAAAADAVREAERAAPRPAPAELPAPPPALEVPPRVPPRAARRPEPRRRAWRAWVPNVPARAARAMRRVLRRAP